MALKKITGSYWKIGTKNSNAVFQRIQTTFDEIIGVAWEFLGARFPLS